MWLDVADRGPGIPPDEVERLKQPFTRASAARARDDGAAGAGLGLAIVDRIARMHGGTFDLLPREGGGTIARVTLPLCADGEGLVTRSRYGPALRSRISSSTLPAPRCLPRDR